MMKDQVAGPSAGIAAGAMSVLLKIKGSERRTLRQIVYESLKLALMSGEFPPGRPLTVREVAELAGTSPMPVREAMKQLVSEGALQHLPNGLMRVALMSRAERDEAREIRAALEGLAVRRAARHAGPAEVAAIERLNRDMAGALADGDAGRAALCNREFHFAIYRAARSEQLSRMIEGLWMQNGPFLMLYTQSLKVDADAAAATLRTHGRIIRALRRHDPDAAERALRRDIGSTAELGAETTADAIADAKPNRKGAGIRRTKRRGRDKA